MICVLWFLYYQILAFIHAKFSFMVERELLNTYCHVVIKKSIKILLRDLFNKLRLDGAQHRMKNLYSTLHEYTAIRIWDTFRTILRPRCDLPSPIQQLSTSLHTIFNEYLLKLNPAPLILIACIPFSPSYHLFARKWRHVVLFGCLLPWGDMLSARVVLNRARRTNKGWSPYAVKGDGI